MDEFDPLVLSKPEEVAARWRCSRSKVWELIASGELGSVKLGRLRRVPAWAERQYVEGLIEKAAG